MNRAARPATVGLLAASMLALAVAPLLMPSDYSVLIHSVSESAAQGVDGAWLARLGLVLFGVGVIILVFQSLSSWTRWARATHTAFGVSIVGTAVFSHAPWDASPYNSLEDLLHSVASFGVGMSFTLGVVLVALKRPAGLRRVFDMSAIAAAVAIPLIMPRVDAAGMAQRAMFLIALAWYCLETLAPRVGRPVKVSLPG